MSGAARGAGGVIKIRLLRGDKVVRSYRVRSESVSFGSGKDCTIRVAGDTTLAEKHATIYIDQGELTLVPEPDAVVLVNGEQVDFAVPKPDDVIKMGRLTLRAELADTVESMVPPPLFEEQEIVPQVVPEKPKTPPPPVAPKEIAKEPVKEKAKAPPPVPRPKIDKVPEIPPRPYSALPEPSVEEEQQEEELEQAEGVENVDYEEEIGEQTYQAVQNRIPTRPETPLDLNEIEDASKYGTEVITLWKDVVLQVKVYKSSRLRKRKSFYVGDHTDCDFPIQPEFLMGRNKVPLVVNHAGGGSSVAFFANSQGDVTYEDGRRVELSELIASGQASAVAKIPGSYSFALPPMARAMIDVGEFTFLVSSVTNPRKLSAPSRLRTKNQIYYVLSLLLHFAVIFLAFFDVPDILGMSFDFLKEGNRQISYDLNILEAEEKEKRLEKKEKELEKKLDKKEKEEKTEDVPQKVGRSIKESGRRSMSTSVTNLLQALGGGGVQTNGRAIIPNILDVPMRGNESTFNISSAMAGLAGQGVSIGRTGGSLSTLGGDEVAGKGSGIAALAQGKSRGKVRGKVTKMSSELKVQGKLSREDIARVVNANINAIQACYERALMGDPTLGGRIVFDWTVTKSGGVRDVRVRSSSIGSSGVANCISGLIKRWKFPKPDGGDVVVTYPFLFRSVSS